MTETACRRAAHFRQFRLPGGGQAVQEPRRAALGVALRECSAQARWPPARWPPLKSFAADELAGLAGMLKTRRQFAADLQRGAVV